MKNNWQKKIAPHIIAIIIFIVLPFIYFSPVMQGETLHQSDITQVMAMTKEARDLYDSTGIHPLWSNSMFSGMPTYTTFTGPSTNLMMYVNKIFTLWLPQPINMLFLAMLGFYFLLRILDFKYYICLFGAIAFGFSSYNLIIIAAGHTTKMMSMAYMAPIVAAMILTYRGKYLLGGALTALLTGAMIYNDHLQIMYYTLILTACVAGGYGIHSIIEKQFKNFVIASIVLIIAGILAVLPASDNLLITKQFAKYSIRDSQSELTLQKKNNEVGKGGLDIDYAYQWSMGKMETFSLLIPNVYGGPVSPDFIDNSALYKTISNAGAGPQQAEQAAGQISNYYYWGPQPFTVPVYFGAIVCFLFVLSFFVVKSWQRWWVLAAAIIGVILSWGKNFAVINDFLFYHLPFYNKFRAPSMALVITQVAVVFLAAWALQKVATSKISKQELWKSAKYTFFITGGILLLFALFSGAFLDFKSANDAQVEQMIGNADLGQKITNALQEDRATLLRNDSWRSLLFVVIATIALWAYIKSKIKFVPFIAIIGIAMLIDLWQVDKRYLNDDHFIDDFTAQNSFQPTAAEQQILQDHDPYYRVLNLSADIFNDAQTSYFLKSIGGYSPAKLWRYQDLIDYQLMPAITRLTSILKNTKSMDSSIANIFGSSPVLNMLNTKYFIINPQGAPVKNPAALGNAWFVQNIQWAPDANAEIKSLNNIDPKTTAVMDQRFKKDLNNFSLAADSSAFIHLTKYGLNKLKYASQNNKEGLGVFSDIYYPAGWKAYIDGKETDILRINYLLRGLKIPAGKHEIEFKFHPTTYYTGQTISLYSSIIVLLLVVIAFVIEIRKRASA